MRVGEGEGDGMMRIRRTYLVVFGLVGLPTLCFLLYWIMREPESIPINYAVGAHSVRVYYDAYNVHNTDYVECRNEWSHATFVDMDLFRASVNSATYTRRRHWYGNHWMGSWLAIVATDDGEEFQLAVSYHSGFYQILGQDGVWVIAEELSMLWQDEFMRLRREAPKSHFDASNLSGVKSPPIESGDDVTD